MGYYDRYNKFRTNGEMKIVPGIAIDKSNDDIYIMYEKSKMRMDTLSYKYYGDANYGWLILQANPALPSMEYMIQDSSVLRIPYPLNSALQRYEHAIEEWNKENE